MDIDIIKKLADEAGLGDMYERPKLQPIGNNTMSFVSSGKLTPFGESMVKFADLVEEKTIEDTI